MALTPAEICTLALLRAGEKQAVDNLNDESIEAQTSLSLYEQARDSVLEERDWPFAHRTAVLGELTITRVGWDYVYALPTDCLMPRYLDIGLRNPAPEQMPDFGVEDDAQEGRILTADVSPARLVYTRKVTETGKFTPLFTEALIWRLAYDFTFAIPVKPGVAERMMGGYEMALNKAAASSFRHMQHGPPARPSALRARNASVRVGRSGEE